MGRASSCSMPLRARLVLLFGLLAALLGGCASPTLPLPPPGEPTVEGPDAEGIVTLTGTAPADVTVIARNLATDPTSSDSLRGAQTGANGVYVIRIPAQIDDRIQLWYRDGLDTSDIVEVVVPP